MNKMILSAALAGLMTAGFGMSASADDKMMEGQAKCYGIAKAGQNACANGSVHACKGQAKVDNDGGDFVMASASDCEKQGGSSEPKK